MAKPKLLEQAGNALPSELKGKANGLAELDASSKVPSTQLPAMDYIPTSEKGEASGVATLDANGKVTSTQLPSLDYIPTSAKGANSGVAELDSAGKVPSSQLPSYVDDVLEYDSYSAFPSTGETGKIYIAKDTNKTYRWSGTAYVEISASLALGETDSTAYRGDRGAAAYAHSQVTSGNPHNVTKSDLGIITPVSKTFTLPAIGAGASVNVTVNGITGDTVGVFGLASNATAAQYAAAAASQLQLTAQTTNQVTIRANGEALAAGLPCVINIIG